MIKSLGAVFTAWITGIRLKRRKKKEWNFFRKRVYEEIQKDVGNGHYASFFADDDFYFRFLNPDDAFYAIEEELRNKGFKVIRICDEDSFFMTVNWGYQDE